MVVKCTVEMLTLEEEVEEKAAAAWRFFTAGKSRQGSRMVRSKEKASLSMKMAKRDVIA